MPEVWTGSETDSDSGERNASLSEDETVQDASGASCPWCEQPVEYTGATCDLDCYSLLYGWAMRNVINGLASFEGMQVPLTLDEQPWYKDVL